VKVKLFKKKKEKTNKKQTKNKKKQKTKKQNNKQQKTNKQTNKQKWENEWWAIDEENRYVYKEKKRTEKKPEGIKRKGGDALRISNDVISVDFSYFRERKGKVEEGMCN
jgi:hypothetical protein